MRPARSVGGLSKTEFRRLQRIVHGWVGAQLQAAGRQYAKIRVLLTERRPPTPMSHGTPHGANGAKATQCLVFAAVCGRGEQLDGVAQLSVPGGHSADVMATIGTASADDVIGP
jgi:hypothetical protein